MADIAQSALKKNLKNPAECLIAQAPEYCCICTHTIIEERNFSKEKTL